MQSVIVTGQFKSLNERYEVVDMRKEWYVSFLNYLGPKELKRLYSNLLKCGVSVKGFREQPPAIMLADLIAQNEKAFYKAIYRFYPPTFSDMDEAVASFAPDRAVMCLAFFQKEGMDETFLSQLLADRANALLQDGTNIADKKGKTVKKEDKFREKYMAERRERQRIEQEYEELRIKYVQLQEEETKWRSAAIQTEQERRDGEKEITMLKCENADLRSELLRLKSSEGKAEEKQREMEAELKRLEERIVQIKSRSVPTDTEKAAKDKDIVLLAEDDREIYGVAKVLTYDRISELKEVTENCRMIVYVQSDIPFSVKRKLERLKTAAHKLRAFKTKGEMIEYIENGGNNNDG